MSASAARALSSSGTTVTPRGYAEILGTRIQEEGAFLSARWLDRLNEVLDVGANDVFPGSELLDHIPALLYEIGAYLRAPAAEDIGANTSVITKARELGLMRHGQRASVHQLLREYEILGRVLETFVGDETHRLNLNPAPDECIAVMGRLNRSMQILLQATVDTFVGEYAQTIEEQTSRLEGFNRTVSHELRNPLGTLQLALTLIRKDGESPGAIDTGRWLGVMQRNIDHMVQTLRSLEDLTRATLRADVPTRQRVEVESVVHEVARQLEEMAGARGVTIEVGAGLPSLHVDAARLELVLMNLVSNAVKYCDPAKPERRVSVVGHHAPTGCRGIAVQDNGLGIPEAVRPRIFEPFYRAHANDDATLGNSGSGLGLAIVDECVRALGGTLEVESAPGHGSRFVLLLPDGPERED